MVGVTEIGHHFGRGHKKIGNLLKKIRDHKTLKNLPTTGKPKLLNDIETRTVVQMAKRRQRDKRLRDSKDILVVKQYLPQQFVAFSGKMDCIREESQKSQKSLKETERSGWNMQRK